VVVLGDINDFEFSQTMTNLEGGELHALMSTLPPEERYSYVFEGNSQSLDHIVVSDSLFGHPFAYDPVHVNAEFFDQLSDHDPQVARFLVDTAPAADAGGPYSVAEGGRMTVSATGSDSAGNLLTYEWDLDDDGTFETAGQSATFSAASLDGPSSHTVTVRVSDGDSATTDGATVTVTNVAPTATFEAPASTSAGFPFTIALTNPLDPSSADTAAGFTYAFNCGDGSGFSAFGASSSRSCSTTEAGTRTVRGKIRNKDGAVTKYTAIVSVNVTSDSLCDLAHEFSSKEDVADALCEKLEDGALGAFRNHVVAQAGKAFTQAEAEILVDLSREL
jgi:PKD domain